jgi:arginyl-tRNA--protein-N-Asp/Glu arginylyltransferase
VSKEQKLSFYATPPDDCNYLPDQSAITLFADPHFPKNIRLYSALVDCGFRRSGEHLYVPHCDSCSSCIPVRIPVSEFTPSRNQKRTLKNNRDMVINKLEADFNKEHFSLYEKYLLCRHAGGGMDNPNPENYMQFLSANWADTIFYEMRRREDNKLMAVAVVDIMENALSAIYTFFDPAYSSLSLGRFSILYEIQEAQKMGLEWLYLGYWIKACKKMSYKNEYRPMEYYRNNEWIRDLDQ